MYSQLAVACFWLFEGQSGAKNTVFPPAFAGTGSVQFDRIQIRSKGSGPSGSGSATLPVSSVVDPNPVRLSRYLYNVNNKVLVMKKVPTTVIR